MAVPMQLRPAMQVSGSSKSSFRGLTSAFQQLSVSPAIAGRSNKLQVEGEWRFLLATCVEAFEEGWDENLHTCSNPKLSSVLNYPSR